MSPVIQVEHLSKHYRLGLIGGGTLREDLHRWWAKARGRPDPLLKIGQEDHGNREGGELWALREVSFQVQEGEILGIIGRNGAGKSTLLKILSRITAPTTGQVKIRGRVGSLLEVGTGFHPELTGRENIYLNGAILGMKRAEIDRKLDEIIDFAEIEQFIDTPVKRYSSGMYVRLAFAVAAHLDPEILLIDEVLAVGDIQFQRKCLGKMEEVSKGGRTVLFVSHNLGSIQQLCTKALVVDHGALLREDGPAFAIAAYLRSIKKPTASLDSNAQDRSQPVTLNQLLIYDDKENIVHDVLAGTRCEFVLSVSSKRTISNVRFLLGFNRLIDNYRIAVCDTDLTGTTLKLSPGLNRIVCQIPCLSFVPGTYLITVRAELDGNILFYHPSHFECTIVQSHFFSTCKIPDPSWGGVMLLDHHWGHAS